jgi:hypothetical protein
VSTQLRLVETLPPAPRTGKVPRAGTQTRAKPTRKQTGNKQTGNKQPRKATRTVGASRRAVQWGDWHLDTRTRTVGRAGVAAARRALEEAAASEQLSEAS